MLQRRLAAAVKAMQACDVVDASANAFMGYCFGGLCALDVARTGLEVNGVVSVHGLFRPATNLEPAAINAKVLALHGWDDPLVPPDQVLALARELTEAGADWQLHGYGGTGHAFTNPAAADPANGMAYNPLADRRSWRALVDFLEELFPALQVADA